LALPDLPDAACRERDPELWFGPHVCGAECDGEQGCIVGKSETGRFRRIRTAKEVCFSCVERDRCLEWALANDQRYGIWGGKTARERNEIRRRRARA
jgi:Transcription factor WhiB.